MTLIQWLRQAGGEVTLEVSPPDENRCRLALLKSMYLALCIKAGVPEANQRIGCRPDGSGAGGAYSAAPFRLCEERCAVGGVPQGKAGQPAG